MMMKPSALPRDIGSLRRMVIEKETLLAEKEAQLAERDRAIAVRDAELYAKALAIENLKAQLAKLRRARFGRSSEKLDREIEQLELTLGELEEGVAESKIRTARADRKSPLTASAGEAAKHGRKPMPAHLPRERIVHEPAPLCTGCGGTVLRKLGEDVTELLEYVPSSFKVVQIVRPKLSCRDCETIAQAPLPSLPIERGRPGPGLLAHVIVSKYADGLPLYRQNDIYARQNIDLDRSTMADWVGCMAALFDPLVVAIGKHVCAGEVLHADDTTVKVLAPGLGRTKTGRLWAAVRDERSFGAVAPPAAFYRYSADRCAEHAQALLASCRGFLHADGYAGFNNLFAEDPKTGKARLAGRLHLISGIAFEHLLADKGYDANWLRAHVAEVGAEAVIPSIRARSQAIPYDKHIYRERNLVERFFNKIKHFRRIGHALRENCDIVRSHVIPGRRHDLAAVNVNRT
jgi:transposase